MPSCVKVRLLVEKLRRIKQMTPQQLKKNLEESLQMYNEEVNYMVETFDQTHQDENLTKKDMEEMGKQTLYLVSELNKQVIKYLEANR